MQDRGSALNRRVNSDMKRDRIDKIIQKSSTQYPEVTTYKLPQPCIAKYLVVVVDRGMASEVNHFDSLEEAKRAFEEIAHDYGYKPEEINGSDKYDVSIWKWTEDRFLLEHHSMLTHIK